MNGASHSFSFLTSVENLGGKQRVTGDSDNESWWIRIKSIRTLFGGIFPHFEAHGSTTIRNDCSKTAPDKSVDDWGAQPWFISGLRIPKDYALGCRWTVSWIRSKNVTIRVYFVDAKKTRILGCIARSKSGCIFVQVHFLWMPEAPVYFVYIQSTINNVIRVHLCKSKQAWRTILKYQLHEYFGHLNRIQCSGGGNTGTWGHANKKLSASADLWSLILVQL